MHLLKRGLVAAAIVGTLMGGMASIPGGAAASAPGKPDGTNCHGALVSFYATKIGGLGNVVGGQDVQGLQQGIREHCAMLFPDGD